MSIGRYVPDCGVKIEAMDGCEDEYYYRLLYK